MSLETTPEITNNSFRIRPGWNSAVALILGICAFSFAKYWPFWSFLWILAFLFLHRPWFVGFSMLAALRLFLLSTDIPPSVDFHAQLQQGTIEECVRTPRGFRMQLLLDQGNSVLLRSKEAILPGCTGTFAIQWDEILPRTVPGSFDSKRWLEAQGAGASGNLKGFTMQDSRWCIQRYAFLAREWLRQLCLRRMGNQSAGIMVALLVGDKSGLDDDVSQSFRDTGLVHILTVSGFHIVFLSAFLQMLLALCQIPRKLLGWITVALLLAFIPVTGSSPAVQRAVLMFFLMHTARVVQRVPLSLHTLGVASSLILYWDPMALWDIGFQLSCGATAGILMGQKKRPEWMNAPPPFLRSWILEPSWITLCATVGTFPFLVYHFQSFPPIAFLGNLIVAPLMGFAMEAGVLLALAAWIPPCAIGFGQAASLLLELSVRITDFFSHVPGAACSFGPWPIWVCLGLLITGLGLLRLSGASRWQKGFVILGATAWVLWAIFTAHPLQIHMLDAWQGDCTVLQFPNGKSILIDVGNGSKQGQFGKRQIAPFLRSQGISSLDAIIITHPDLDHFGGAGTLLENFRVKSIWLPRAARLCEKPEWLTLLRAISLKKIPIHTVMPGMEFLGLGNYNLRWLWAEQDALEDDWNAVSASFVLYQRHRSLFFAGGDLAIPQEDVLIRDSIVWRGIPKAVQVLKISHHGSKHSTSPLFLESLNPELALISAGAGNRYGHPHKEVLAHLREKKIPWLNTAHNGSIRLHWEHDSLSVESFRDTTTIFEDRSGNEFARR